jgi:hypothetical protein
MIGKRVEMLEVVERLPGSKVVCLCDCGNKKTLLVGHFNTGKLKSCGCHTNKHGHASNKNRSREYISYHNMIARCHKPTNKRYADYGGAGITVCERWRKSFVNFLNDMGECPHGFTIDRKDNNLGYFKENCRWVSREKNQGNRSNSIIWNVFGVDYSSARQAAEVHGVSGHTIMAWCRGRASEGRYYPPKEGCSFAYRYGGQS